MNADERRRYDMLVRVKQFGDDNAADFPAGTVAATQFAKVDAEVASTENKGASQAVGFGQAAQEYDVKGTARENLRELMSEITRTARSMEYAFDGIHEKFRMPRNRNDADHLNTGRAFCSSPPARGGVAAFRRRGGGRAAPYNADFRPTASPPPSSPTSPFAPLLPEEGWRRFADGVVGATPSKPPSAPPLRPQPNT